MKKYVFKIPDNPSFDVVLFGDNLLVIRQGEKEIVINYRKGYTINMDKRFILNEIRNHFEIKFVKHIVKKCDLLEVYEHGKT